MTIRRGARYTVYSETIKSAATQACVACGKYYSAEGALVIIIIIDFQFNAL